jgi:hypothetical protein
MNEAMRAFWQGRLDAAMARALVMETALDSLVSGGIQSYQLDTGATRQLVTRANLATLRDSLESTYSLISTLSNRLGCGGVTRVVPGF